MRDVPGDALLVHGGGDPQPDLHRPQLQHQHRLHLQAQLPAYHSGLLPGLPLRDDRADPQPVHVPEGGKDLQALRGLPGGYVLPALHLQGQPLLLRYDHLRHLGHDVHLRLQNRRDSRLHHFPHDDLLEHGVDDGDNNDNGGLRGLQALHPDRKTHQHPLRELGSPHRVRHGRCPYPGLRHEQK